MHTTRYFDVVIVGAGIAGSSLVWRLSRAGAKVALLDRQPPGQEASGGYAGLLTTVADGHEGDAYAELSREALQCMLRSIPELEAESGHDVELMCTPLLRLADDEPSLDLLREYARRPDAIKAGDTWVESAGLREVCPAISPRIKGAVLSQSAHHLNPRALLAANLDAAKALVCSFDAAVEALIVQGERVAGVIDRAGRQWYAGHVVLANGAWSGELLRAQGIELRQVPVRGQLVVLDGSKAAAVPCIVNTGRGYIVPKRSSRIVVGATHENAGFVKAATLGGHLHLARVAGVLGGLMTMPIIDTFVGLRPMSPDGMPLLGSVNALQGLTLALGYGQHGVLLSQLCAEMCVHHISGQPAPPLWSAFQAQRAVGNVETGQETPEEQRGTQ